MRSPGGYPPLLLLLLVAVVDNDVVVDADLDAVIGVGVGLDRCIGTRRPNRGPTPKVHRLWAAAVVPKPKPKP